MREPIYRRIAEDLRQQIESGQLGRGSKLPTEIELREKYDASRNTVRDALRSLITRGLIETRAGQGTFVVEKIDPFVTDLSASEPGSVGIGVSFASQVRALQRKPTFGPLRVEMQQADKVVAETLGLREGTAVVSRHQQLFLDGTPWSLQTTFYPMRFVEEGATRLISVDDIPEGAVKYLGKQLGIRQVGYSDRIAVRPPDQNEAVFFRLPEDGRVSVIEVLRTGFDQSEQPLRFTRNVYPADRNQFIVNMGKVPELRNKPTSEDPDRVANSDGRPEETAVQVES